MPGLPTERIFRDLFSLRNLNLSLKWKLCLDAITCLIGATKGYNSEGIYSISKAEIMKTTEV